MFLANCLFVVLFWKWNLKMALFLRAVLAVMSGTLLCSAVDGHWSEPGPSCCWLISHFCRLSLSCRFCPHLELWNLTSEGTCTQRGQSLHYNNWPWARKSPQSWLCWNSPSALPSGRTRTEHNAATFRISFQNRITTYQYMQQIQELQWVFLILYLNFLIDVSFHYLERLKA